MFIGPSRVCLGPTEPNKRLCCFISDVAGVPIPPKDGENALWPSTNGAIPYFLVLPGSELSITEITEYTYLIPWKHLRDAGSRINFFDTLP